MPPAIEIAPAQTTSLPRQGPAPRPSEKWQSKWRARFEESKGMLMVFTSEVFAAGMAAATKLLQRGEDERGMGTLQILFARFSITFVLSSAYMWYTRTPHFPFGAPEVRIWLVLRGLSGFCAIYGYYFSLRYLPLAEAVLIIFLTPLLTAYASSLFLHEPFSRIQLLAGLLSFGGIVIMTVPSLSPSSATPHSPSVPAVTAYHRLLAIVFGLLSDFGATAAFTLVRVIGTRAHPLISVNYYALLTTVLSTCILLFVPGLHFVLPADLREWMLLAAVGVFGFILQTLLTMGLVRDRSAKATNMMYFQVVFALILDWGLWNVVPTLWTWIGGAVVVAATLWGVLQKAERKVVDEEYRIVPRDGEERAEEDVEEELDEFVADDSDLESEGVKISKKITIQSM